MVGWCIIEAGHLQGAARRIQNLIYSSTKEFLNTADNVNAV